MRWVDVAGPPGVGKSAILDSLWPRKPEPDGEGLPTDWSDAFDLAVDLAARGAGAAEARGLIEVTFAKVATISRMPGDGIYVQAGLAQIGLELGWRLAPWATAEFYRAMPVSAGVVFMTAFAETVEARNMARPRNFAERVRPMLDAAAAGHDVLAARGIPLLVIDTGMPIEANRDAVRAFYA